MTPSCKKKKLRRNYFDVGNFRAIRENLKNLFRELIESRYFAEFTFANKFKHLKENKLSWKTSNCEITFACHLTSW